MELNREDMTPVSVPPGIAVRKGTLDDAEGIAKIWPAVFIPHEAADQDPLNDVNKHIREALVYAVAENNGKIVSVIFIKDASSWVRAPAIEVAKGTTDSEYRGQGLLGAVMQYAIQLTDARRRVLGQIFETNTSSIRALQKASFRHIGTLRTSVFCGFTKYRIIPK